MKPFTTLIDLLRWQATQTPHQTAYTFLKDGEKEASSLTYVELDQRAKVIAAHLQLQQQVLFEATDATIKKVMKNQSGVVVTLHPYGKDLKVNYHVHVLVPEGGMDEKGRWKILASKLNLWSEPINPPSLHEVLFHSGGVGQVERIPQQISMADLHIEPLTDSEYSGYDYEKHKEIIAIGYRSAQSSIAQWVNLSLVPTRISINHLYCPLSRRFANNQIGFWKKQRSIMRKRETQSYTMRRYKR
ncbi:MAG: transposase [Chloroflexota bacterium]